MLRSTSTCEETPSLKNYSSSGKLFWPQQPVAFLSTTPDQNHLLDRTGFWRGCQNQLQCGSKVPDTCLLRSHVGSCPRLTLQHPVQRPPKSGSIRCCINGTSGEQMTTVQAQVQSRNRLAKYVSNRGIVALNDLCHKSGRVVVLISHGYKKA